VLFSRLFQRRTLWFPTRLGCLLLLVVMGAPLVLWCFFGEGFLSRTERVPAEALVIEGWIGIQGVRAAKAEFDAHGYRYIVTAGGPTENRWGSQRWNYAIEAEELLHRLGVPADKVIAAPAPDSANHRTFESALCARMELDRRGLYPSGVNVITLGVHARRSRLVFAKALSGTEVGVVAWDPAEYKLAKSWWDSSERAVDFLKETVGWLFELLFNSGRWSNQPPKEVGK